MDNMDFALGKLRELGALTIDMVEAFNRGNLDKILFASDSAILIKHKAGMHMLWCDDAAEGIRALSCVAKANAMLNDSTSVDDDENIMHCCIAHGRPALEAVTAATDFFIGEACLQYCRYSKEIIPLRGICAIRPLTTKDAAAVIEHYHMMSDINEAYELIDNELMYGADIDGELVGFIGWHSDGSAGMLEVFPEYRRRGIGVELECFMHNLHVERGWIPYGHVYASNEASHKLQGKLDLTVSSDNIWWTFDEDED